MRKTTRGFVYWFPRVLGIVYALFLLIFSFDVFGEGAGLWQSVLAFVVHSIPSIFLFVIVLLAWKKEIVGAVGFILFGTVYMIFAALRASNAGEMISWSFVIALPAFLVGIFFVIGWKNMLTDRYNRRQR